MEAQAKVPQLLSVWNPYFEPETIQVHVELLRSHGKVWWARLYRGSPLDEAAARDKYAQVDALWEEARVAGRELVLFVTNFVMLHALRVDGIVFGGRLAPEEIPFAPSHYFQEPEDGKGPHPAIWFRVRDVRALAFNQVETLRYFFDRVIDAASFGYDPFASYKWNYPAVVRGPAAERIFEPALLDGRGRMFADLAETLFPPEVQNARRKLEAKLGSHWGLLEDRSRIFLASAWVIYEQYRRHRDFDLSSALTGAARAVETELCNQLIKPAARALRLESVFGNLPITLGSSARFLDALAEGAREQGVLALQHLAGNESWREWLDRFVDLRNDAAHAKPVRRSRVEKAWREIVGEPTQLAPLLAAKKRLAESLRGDGPIR